MKKFISVMIVCAMILPLAVGGAVASASPDGSYALPTEGSIEIMTWVPPYSIQQCQDMVQADFGEYDARDGLTRIGLQFWVPSANGTVKYADHEWYTPNDADVAWWQNWCSVNNIECLLCVYNNNGSWDWDLARSAFATNRTTFVNALISEMDRLNLDGIDIDLEGIGSYEGDRGAFDQFIHDLWVELDSRGKILTIDTFCYIWNAPNQNWWSDWVGEVDNIHSMGYADLYEGGTTWHKYSYQQNAGYAAGYAGYEVLMGFPAWLSNWGASSGRGTSALAHVQEVRYDLAEPTGIAIWDLQLSASAWQESDLWSEIAALKSAGESDEVFSFSVTADMRQYSGPGVYDNSSYFRGAVEAIAGLGGGDFMISPGDIDPPDGVFWTIEQVMGTDYMWYPVVGNHEEETPEDMEWLRSYDYDQNGTGVPPDIVNTGPSGSTETNYSFDYKNVHFVVLNEYCDTGGDDVTDGDIPDHLYNWLVADLQATSKEHIIVSGHEPAYPQPDQDNGRERHMTDSLNQFPANRDRFWNLLSDWGVVAYICGHTHNYSAIEIDGVWQIDVGHARGIGDTGAASTFVMINVDGTTVSFDCYRDNDGDSDYDDITHSGILTNNPPAFSSDPVIEADAIIDVPYSGTITDDASDPDAGDTLSFSRIDGPTWLTVAGDGTLSGTPTIADLGLGAWTVQVSDGNGGIDQATLNITVKEPQPEYFYATQDIPVRNSGVTGSYLDTLDSDDNYEGIRERESGGKPSKRHSYLEHKWVIPVTEGLQSYIFNIEAYHTANDEGDDFVFAYSTNDAGYTDMLQVNKTSDDDQNQTFILPETVSGSIYIRVTDTDQASGNRNLDTIYIDHMYIEGNGTPSPNNPPDSPGAPEPADGATSTGINPLLSVYASDPDGDTMDITFYEVSGVLIGTVPGILSGSRASIQWSGLEYDTAYSWYATAYDGKYTSTSVTWAFTTGGEPQAGGIYVWDISWASAGKNLKSGVTIKWDSDGDGIAETSDQPVIGATVYYTLTHEQGASQEFIEITDANGQINIQWKKAPSGSYVGEVSDIYHDTYIYYSELDQDNPDNYDF
ncbi:metallophosphoesterase [Chloroflexota bacterium]